MKGRTSRARYWVTVPAAVRLQQIVCAPMFEEPTSQLRGWTYDKQTCAVAMKVKREPRREKVAQYSTWIYTVSRKLLKQQVSGWQRRKQVPLN